MLSIIMRFVLLGTFFGGGVFVIVRDMASASALPSLSALLIAPVKLLFIAVLSWFLSLPFGLLPTCAAGFCYWYILHRYTKNNPRLIFRAVLGGVSGLMASVIFGLPFLFSEEPGTYPPGINLLSWSCAGAIGGALSALLVRDATYAASFGDREVTREG